jgi:hypothetical protein
MRRRSVCLFSRQRWVLICAIGVMAVFGVGAIVRAECGADVAYPTAVRDITAKYGCSGIFNARLQTYSCTRNVINGCGGTYMTGPGDCVCNGTGDTCDQSFVGPPTPIEMDWEIYENTTCRTNQTQDGCDCVSIFLGDIVQDVSNCMGCPPGA